MIRPKCAVLFNSVQLSAFFCFVSQFLSSVKGFTWFARGKFFEKCRIKLKQKPYHNTLQRKSLLINNSNNDNNNNKVCFGLYEAIQLLFCYLCIRASDFNCIFVIGRWMKDITQERKFNVTMVCCVIQAYS